MNVRLYFTFNDIFISFLNFKKTMLWRLRSFRVRDSRIATIGRNGNSAGEESASKIFIPLGITSSGTRNPPEIWDSAGNYQLIDEESNRGRGFRWESPAHLR
jgi:hypothetical protein